MYPKLTLHWDILNKQIGSYEKQAGRIQNTQQVKYILGEKINQFTFCNNIPPNSTKRSSVVKCTRIPMLPGRTHHYFVAQISPLPWVYGWASGLKPPCVCSALQHSCRNHSTDETCLSLAKED